MKENQTSEDVTKTPSEKNSPNSSEKNNSASQTTTITGEEDEEKKEGDEFIREGHGHNYSTPVASEDGGTEDQSANQNTEMSQPTDQGKTQGESSTI